MLVWPSDLPPPPARLVGADSVHRLLVGWLEGLGHRRQVPPPMQGPSQPSGSHGTV